MPAAQVECTDALGAVELVARERERIDLPVLDRDGDVADGLHGVRMEEDATRAAERADRGDWLDGADLVVGRHDGDEEGVGPQGLLDLLGPNAALCIDIEVRHLDALRQCLAGMQHGMMLDLRRDDVAAAMAQSRLRERADDPVVALAAAAREEEFIRLSIEERGELAPRLAYGLARRAAGGVEARGIAELLAEVRQHLLDDARIDGRRRRVIEIDRLHRAHPTFFACSGWSVQRS